MSPRRRLFPILVVPLLVAMGGSDALAQGTAVPKEVVTSDWFPRLRLGASAGFGVGTLEFGMAASARGGIQISDGFAVSYQISGASTGLWGDFARFTSHAALFEYTVPGTLFTVGAGPSFASGEVGHSCEVMFWAADCTASSKSFMSPGLEGRVAFIPFGINGPDRRGGLTVDLAGHVARYGSTVVMGIGFDVF